MSLPFTAFGSNVQKFEPGSVSCSVKNTTVTFSGIKKDYPIFDHKNSTSVKVLGCEKIKVQNYTFYSINFSSEVHTGNEYQKVLTFEIALWDAAKGELKTARSETIDQIDKSADSVTGDFENNVKPTWSYSKSKDTVLLKIEILNKKEKIEPYFLLYNKKTQWFENVFLETLNKKTK